MKPPLDQCAYLGNGYRCSFRVWKHGERFCIRHDIAETLKNPALDKVVKHHARTCTYWVFSGDRHCSCGSDQARGELARIRAVVGISFEIGELEARTAARKTHNKLSTPDTPELSVPK